MTSSTSPVLVQSGHCPDEQCNAKLFFPQKETSVECTSCGQRHNKSALKNIEDVTDAGVALHNIIRNVLVGATKPKKGSDTIKVQGISNYQCKLLSPFLTRYGMDKHTGKARLLTEMGQPETFDCSVLGSRNFMIEQEYIEVHGYGRDRTGSQEYLADTLASIKLVNGNEERLLPVHADGDGHCLVHAISRALVGRELFWHALRDNLKKHFREHLDRYKMLFRDFIDQAEWSDIIAECDPAYIPGEGETLGLRNIHILGLANVLRRPIILLDSLHGIQNSGDYTGVFLPGLVPLEKCRSGPNKRLNPPLCVAWSSRGRNHYIALVAVKDRPVPVLPTWMLPKVWGMPQELIDTFIQRNEKGHCIIGGSTSLQPSYVLRLTTSMEELFYEQYGVSTALVADVHQCVYKTTGLSGINHNEVLRETRDAVANGRLYRCLTCEAITHWNIPLDWLRPGGKLYELAVSIYQQLKETKKYSFPTEGVTCGYDGKKDELYVDEEKSEINNCPFCQGNQMRKVDGSGKPVYMDGDRTLTRTTCSTCKCGYKHYWQGTEYDNLPQTFPINLEWGGKQVAEQVAWFQNESDPALNSNVYEVAQALVQKHFPGEFGSERLVQNVVDKILRYTAVKEDVVSKKPVPEQDPLFWKPDAASKVILSGGNSKGIHKEDLTKNETERTVKRRVEAKAGMQQRRKSEELSRQAGSGGKGKATPGSPLKVSAKQQKTEPTPSTSAGAQPGAEEGAVGGAAAGAHSDMPPAKKVRVSASDGRQLVLSLEASVSISLLRERLQSELGVPRARFKIRHGFPPRILDGDDSDDKPLPIQNGDKLNVEILPDPNEVSPVPIREPKGAWPAKPDTRNAWSNFEPNSHDASAQSMLRGLEHLQDVHDNVSSALGGLAVLANIQGKDMWSMVQGMPHLFSVGGLFYKQVQNEAGLTDMKHYKIPLLPGKTFRYAQRDDRLELCLEPHGHYQVAPGIERQVLGAAILPSAPSSVAPTPSPSVSQAMSVGSSGVVVNRSMNFSGPAFSGHGHSLGGSSDARMPGELPQRTRKLSDSGSGHSFEAVIPEDEGEEAEEEEQSMETETVHTRRIGPGYSVVEQGSVNETAAVLQRLASQIESIAEGDEDEEEEHNVQGDYPSFSTVAMDTAPTTTAPLATRPKPAEMVMETESTAGTDTVAKSITSTGGLGADTTQLKNPSAAAAVGKDRGDDTMTTEVKVVERSVISKEEEEELHNTKETATEKMDAS